MDLPNLWKGTRTREPQSSLRGRTGVLSLTNLGGESPRYIFPFLILRVLPYVQHFYHFLSQPNSLETLDLSNTDCALDQVSPEGRRYDVIRI